jgi:hypothetical protein
VRKEAERISHKRVQRVYHEAGLCVKRIRRQRLCQRQNPELGPVGRQTGLAWCAVKLTGNGLPFDAMSRGV